MRCEEKREEGEPDGMTEQRKEPETANPAGSGEGRTLEDKQEVEKWARRKDDS